MLCHIELSLNLAVAKDIVLLLFYRLWYLWEERFWEGLPQWQWTEEQNN